MAKQSDILTIPEDRAIILRGISTVLNAPLMITFRNQSQAVAVSVGSVNQEFRNTTYEKYNKSMSQLMDSMEIMMHMPAPTIEEKSSGEDSGAGEAQPSAAAEPAVPPPPA